MPIFTFKCIFDINKQNYMIYFIIDLEKVVRDINMHINPYIQLKTKLPSVY